MELTIVGGGLAGLVAAVEAAERGLDVHLLEAHTELGGRARTSAPPHVAQEGPHVFYSDGATWAWLRRRELVPATAGVPVSGLRRFYFRYGGRLQHVPPRALLAVLGHRTPAPVDLIFQDWAAGQWGAEAAGLAAAASGVATFHFDPGSSSARFVHDRLRRVFSLPPRAIYVRGGWPTLIGELRYAAEERGVRIPSVPGSIRCPITDR